VNILKTKSSSNSTCPIFDDAYLCFNANTCPYVESQNTVGQALIIAKNKFIFLAENSSEIIALLNNNYYIDYINRPDGIFITDQVVGVSIYNYIPKKHLDLVKKNLKSVRDNCVSVRYQTDFIKSDGMIYIYETTASPISCCNRVVAILLIIKNITEKIRTEKELAEEHNRLLRKTIALEEVIFSVNKEKCKIINSIYKTLNCAINPIIKRLKKDKSGLELSLLNMIESTMEKNAENILEQMDGEYVKLTQKESQICLMVKNGFSVKDIASFYHLSERTIDKHRENIRKKFGLQKTGKNLYIFLKGGYRSAQES
jgi:PAS domain S-box-containing protein